MTPIEKKIKNNKLLFEEKFVNKNSNSALTNEKIGIEFRNYWDKGWDNGKSFRPIVPNTDSTPSDEK